MNAGTQGLVSLFIVLVGGLAILLLIIGVSMEMKDWRKAEQSRHHDMERTGGWRESAGALWVVILGLGAGTGSAFLLQEPLTRLAVDIFIYKTPLPTLVNWISANPIVLLALLLLIIVGPLCAGLVDPRTRIGCVICGALAGGAAGATFSALLGQAVISLVSHAGILNLSLSTTPYQEIDWLNQLGLAVNNTFPWTYGAIGGLTAFCAALGGLLAGLVPNRDPHRRRVIWAAPLAIAASPMLMVVMIINVVILALLGPAIQRILDQTGNMPAFSPNWIIHFGYGLPLLVLAMIQLLALSNPRLSRLPTNQRWMVAVGLAGLGLFEILLLLLARPGAMYAMPVALLALESWIAARRLAAPVGASASEKMDVPATSRVEAFYAQPAVYEPPTHERRGRGKPLLPHWGATGLAAGLLVGLLAQIIVSAALVITMIDVNLLTTLADLKIPAIDPGKAEELLRGEFTVIFAAALGTLLACTFFGLVAGLLLQWTQNNLFLPLVWVWLSRLGSRGSRFYPAHKGSRRLLAGLGGLLIGISVTKLETDPPVFALLTALLTIGLLSTAREDVLPNRWPRWSIIACFAVAAAGWIGMLVPWGTNSIPATAIRAVSALLVGPALGVALFHLISIARPARQGCLRLGALTILVVFNTLGSLPVIGSTDLRARVFTYDGAGWQKVDFSPLPVGEGIAFYFHTDRKGNFWLASQTGLYLRRTATGWQPFLLKNSDSNSNEDGDNRLMEQSYPPYLTENADGTFWVVVRSQPGLFNPEETKTLFAAPGKAQGDTSIAYAPHKSPAVGLAVEPDGDPHQNTWLATLGSGLLQIPVSRSLENMNWTIYDTANSGLRSNDLTAVLADRAGNVWAASSLGVDRFDGQSWRAVENMDLKDANCLFEDAQGRIWVGTDTGGARWGGSGWQALSADPGWPGKVKIRRFFQDPDGHILAGTEQGALHFDGQRWEWIAQGKSVSVFAEAPDSSLWMGGDGQAARLHPDGTMQKFDAADIGLPDGTVMDIHIEAGGRVWVSIAALRSPKLAGWEIPLITGLLFAAGLAVVLLRRNREPAG